MASRNGVGANSPAQRTKTNVLLDDRERAFANYYIETMAGGESARRAGYKDPRQAASRLLRRPNIRAMIEEALKRVEQVSAVTAADVVGRLWDLATADTRDVIEYRRGACRHCHGIGHGYHFTPAEYQKAEADHQRELDMGNPVGKFDSAGGLGFDERMAPHEDCPECFGKGRGFVVIADTDRMTDKASLLLAGIKQTREGVEVKLHSQVDALVNVGRHLGVFNDRLNVDANVTVNPLAELFDFLRAGPGRIRPGAAEQVTPPAKTLPAPSDKPAPRKGGAPKGERVATVTNRLLKTATKAKIPATPAAKKAAATRKKT